MQQISQSASAADTQWATTWVITQHIPRKDTLASRSARPRMSSTYFSLSSSAIFCDCGQRIPTLWTKSRVWLVCQEVQTVPSSLCEIPTQRIKQLLLPPMELNNSSKKRTHRDSCSQHSGQCSQQAASEPNLGLDWTGLRWVGQGGQLQVLRSLVIDSCGKQYIHNAGIRRWLHAASYKSIHMSARHMNQWHHGNFISSKQWRHGNSSKHWCYSDIIRNFGELNCCTLDDLNIQTTHCD